jgi:hypothetical protein
MAQRVISPETAGQYRNEERALLRKRYKHAEEQIALLLDVMEQDTIAPLENAHALCRDLDKIHGTSLFKECEGMGAILRLHLQHMLEA